MKIIKKDHYTASLKYTLHVRRCQIYLNYYLLPDIIWNSLNLMEQMTIYISLRLKFNFDALDFKHCRTKQNATSYLHLLKAGYPVRILAWKISHPFQEVNEQLQSVVIFFTSSNVATGRVSLGTCGGWAVLVWDKTSSTSKSQINNMPLFWIKLDTKIRGDQVKFTTRIKKTTEIQQLCSIINLRCDNFDCKCKYHKIK